MGQMNSHKCNNGIRFADNLDPDSFYAHVRPSSNSWVLLQTRNWMELHPLSNIDRASSLTYLVLFFFLFSFFFSGIGGGGVSLWLANSMWFSFWPVLRWERKRAGTRHVLGILHLFADLVAENFVPVDLGASNRELPAQSFKGRVRHRLVVLTDGRL